MVVLTCRLSSRKVFFIITIACVLLLSSFFIVSHTYHADIPLVPPQNYHQISKNIQSTDENVNAIELSNKIIITSDSKELADIKILNTKYKIYQINHYDDNGVLISTKIINATELELLSITEWSTYEIFGIDNVSYGDGWIHYNYTDGTQAHKFVPTNYLRWDGEWRPRIEMNMSSGDWPYLVEEFDTYYLITRLDDSLTLSKTYRTYDFQPYKIGVRLTLTPVQLNGMSTYHNVGGTDYWYITIPQSIKQTAKHLKWDNKLPTVRNNTMVNYTDDFGENYTTYGTLNQSNFKYHTVAGEFRFYYNQIARSFGIASTEIEFKFDSYIINGSGGWQNTIFNNTTASDSGNTVIGIYKDYANRTNSATLGNSWNESGDEGKFSITSNEIKGLNGVSASYPYIITDELNLDNNSDYTLQFDTKHSVTSSRSYYRFYHNSSMFLFSFNNDGQMRYMNSTSDWVNIRSYTAATYYLIRMEYLSSNDTADLYVDDVLYVNFRTSSSTGSKIQIHSSKSSYPGIVYVDNIRLHNTTSGNAIHWYDAGSGYQTTSFIVNMTTPTNTNYTVWYADNGSSFSQIGGTYTGNQTPSISGTKYQNTDLRIIMSGNSTVTPEEVEVTFITEATTVLPVVTLLSQTPPIIYTNSTGYINISYGITHGASGLNNTSVSFIYRNYDYDLSDSNHSIRPPANDLASVWNFNGRILRAANRNETPGLNFENNDTITGGDTYTWSGLDENSTKLTVVPVSSTYTKVYINATVHCIMPQMWYLDRTDQQQATKTQLPIHKTSNVLIKFWNFDIFKGNYDFLGVGYTDTSLHSNPALWPSDTNPVNFYYVNSSYDPATGGDPITSGYAVYMGSLNASGWVDHVYSRSNSNYVRGFIDNNYLHTVINTTNISYLYFTSNTESSKPYYINMTNVATSTNVSFVNTNTLWAGNNPPYTLQAYTPNIWFAFMKLNMSLDHKLYAADNNDLWGNSTMNRTNITQALFPPTRPTIDHFHFPTPNDTDYDMDGVYYGNFSIGCGVSTDPDGGDVTHNLTLHYDNKTFVAIINNTFTDKDITHNGVYFDANFSSIPYYSQTDNYTLRLIATDDESESVTVWLGVNFSLDGSPRIISYSPETPVSSSEGENQTFSITTNLIGNVTWYIDSVEVFNETDVNSSSYSNSTAVAGVYNVTVITTNTNGSNSMTWDWTVSLPKRIPLSIFIMWSVIMCAGVIIGFMTTGLYGITSSLLTATIAYMNSKNIINGNVVQYFSGISTSDTIVVGYRSIESLPMSYIYLFIAIVMVIVFILQVKNEIQYNLEPDMDGEFFDE